MNRLLSIPLAATLSLAMPAGAAFAFTTYDARTLGMGGSSVGYSGNGSLAYWNPAAVAMSRNVGVFLPTFSMSLSNNILSPGEVASLASGLQNLGQGSTNSDLTSVFSRLGGTQGLNVQAEAIFEPIGVSLGRVGPGSMAFRLYGQGMADAHLSLSSDLSNNLNGLIFQGGFTNLANSVTKLSTAANSPGSVSQSELKADVDDLKSQLEQNMKSFVKQNGNYTTKNLSLTETAAVDAAAALTYAQPLPVKIAALPKAEITVGATAKVFGAPNSMFAQVGQFALPGGTGNEHVSPIGGGAGAEVSLNIDKEVTDLSNAISAFESNQNIATTADLAAKTGAFFNNGLSKSSLEFTSTTPDNVGLGVDLGAAMKINDEWSVGMSIINPLLLWNATTTKYRYDFSGDQIKLVSVGAPVKAAFRDAEPLTTRAGVCFQPEFKGPAWIAKGLMINAGVEDSFLTSYGAPPSIELGVEKTFAGIFAVRLGTSQLGLEPLYTAGLGIQNRAVQMNLGVGVDNPSANVKAVAAAFTFGVGF